MTSDEWQAGIGLTFISQCVEFSSDHERERQLTEILSEQWQPIQMLCLSSSFSEIPCHPRPSASAATAAIGKYRDRCAEHECQ